MTKPKSGTEATLDPTRRTFLKGSAAILTAASAGTFSRPSYASGLGDQEITVALVGCGGRGTGAAYQALSTQGKVKLIAMADAFRDRLDSCYEQLEKRVAERLSVPEENKYTGFGAYKKAIDSGADVVILATPPGFRPDHFSYAVEQKKHIFMEKPVAVDGPGIRQVLEAAESAKARNLKIGVGLQRHHYPQYLETVQRIHDGEIGDVVLTRVYWNSSGVWVRERQENQTEMEYQMRNWYYFNWLCGDHIVEQHIHNLDVGNWVKNDVPISAQGQGGRQVRNGRDHGEIYDHHMVEYTYRDGSTMLSQCRHIKGCWESVAEHAHGTKGSADVSAARITPSKGSKWRYRGGEEDDPYQIEHDHLFDAIRNDKPHNEAKIGAQATLTAILGRMATYSGRQVTWDEALESQLSLRPAEYNFKADPPVLPNAAGHYDIAVPGVTKAL